VTESDDADRARSRPATERLLGQALVPRPEVRSGFRKLRRRRVSLVRCAWTRTDRLKISSQPGHRNAAAQICQLVIHRAERGERPPQARLGPKAALETPVRGRARWVSCAALMTSNLRRCQIDEQPDKLMLSARRAWFELVSRIPVVLGLASIVWAACCLGSHLCSSTFAVPMWASSFVRVLRVWISIWSSLCYVIAKSILVRETSPSIPAKLAIHRELLGIRWHSVSARRAQNLGLEAYVSHVRSIGPLPPADSNRVRPRCARGPTCPGARERRGRGSARTPQACLARFRDQPIAFTNATDLPRPRGRSCENPAPAARRVDGLANGRAASP